MNVDSTTGLSSLENNVSGIRCFEKGCEGTIKSEITIENSVHWRCPVCGNEGVISEWQAIKWNNVKYHKTILSSLIVCLFVLVLLILF